MKSRVSPQKTLSCSKVVRQLHQWMQFCWLLDTNIASLTWRDISRRIRLSSTTVRRAPLAHFTTSLSASMRTTLCSQDLAVVSINPHQKDKSFIWQRSSHKEFKCPTTHPCCKTSMKTLNDQEDSRPISNLLNSLHIPATVNIIPEKYIRQYKKCLLMINIRQYGLLAQRWLKIIWKTEIITSWNKNHYNILFQLISLLKSDTFEQSFFVLWVHIRLPLLFIYNLLSNIFNLSKKLNFNVI